MNYLYSLLIGIDCYLPNELPDGASYKSLKGCVRDINLVEAFLKRQFNLPSEQIYKLTASNVDDSPMPSESPEMWPTYENIVKKFKELTEIAQPKDQVYIHYSGHGGRAVTIYPELKLELGFDETLVPLDIGKPTSRYLRDLELAELLQKMVNKGLVVTVVLDSCHSGGATRAGDSDIRGADANTVDTTLRPTESLVASASELAKTWRDLTGGTRSATVVGGMLPFVKDYVLLAACRPSEYAYEYAFNGKERNGALTYWWLDSLQNRSLDLTYQELYSRINAKVHSQFQQQTPMLLGEGNRLVLGSNYESLQYTVTVMQVDAGKNPTRLKLNAGIAQGVEFGSLFTIYPRTIKDITQEDKHLAIAEVTEIGVTDAWAEIIKTLLPGEIEQGASADNMTAPVDLIRGVRLVKCTPENTKLSDLPPKEINQQAALQAVAIASVGNGWVKLVADEEVADYQVSINKLGEYEICEPTGKPFSNLRPPLKVGESNAAAKLVKRLVHLTKYEENEIHRLEYELKKYQKSTETWNQGNKEQTQLFIIDNFDEINKLSNDEREQKLLQESVLDCLNPLSQCLKEDPKEFIEIVKTWCFKKPGVRLLLVIDQFEELITLSPSIREEKRKKQQNLNDSQQFLKLLEATLAAKLLQLSIVITLRSDFEPRLLNLETLKSYWTHARFPIRAMRSDELRQAIELPAAEMALYFEQLKNQRNSVDKLVDEVGQMPGALPLLSFTLSELYIKLAKKWKDRETSDRALTLDAEFDQEGGIAGSLTRRANKEYDSLPDDAHKATMRRVMLRMVTIEGGESPRRRVPSSELVYADEAENKRIKEIINRLDQARLIIGGQETGKPYVEPAHDFLVRSWDKLQNWQQEEQEKLSLQRRLTPAAEEWESVKNKDKEQPKGILDKLDPILDKLDRGLFTVENLVSKIPTQLVRLLPRFQNRLEHSREKPVQFLWDVNPYLNVLREELNSNNNWFNQVEAEFVQESALRKRQNISWRWRIAITVMVGLRGLTIAALIGQQNALEKNISTLAETSKASLLANRQLEALVAAVQSGKQLRNPILFQDTAARQIASAALQRAVYNVQERNRLEGSSSEVTSVVFSPDGKILASGSTDKTIKLWNLATGKVIHTLNGHSDKVMSVVFSPDGKILASGSTDSSVKLWDVATGKVIHTLNGHSSGVNSVVFSPDGKTLASGSLDNSIKLWDVATGKVINTLNGHSSGVNSVVFSPDGKTLASGSLDNSIKLWGVATGTEIKTLKGDSGYVNTVVFSPDGRTLASGSTEKTIKLWDVATGKAHYTLEDSGLVTSVVFSPDGRTLASAGSTEKTIKLWDVATGTEINTLNGHSSEVNSVVFSPDGKTLASGGSSDETVKLWDVGTGTEIKTLKGHSSMVNSVVFSPDGKTLASGSSDRTVKLWNFYPNNLNDLMIRSCDRLSAYLQINPNISDSDRKLCDDVPKVVAKDKSF